MVVWRGIAIGLAATFGVTVTKLAVAEAIGHPTPYLLYFAAVLAAAWFGGVVAGLTTTALAAAAGYAFFVEPIHGPIAAGFARAAFFLAEGAMITWLTSRLVDAATTAQRAAADTSAALAQVRAVIEGAGDGVSMQDRSGRLVFVNELAARMSGFESPEAMLAASPQTIWARHQFLSPDGEPLSLEELPGRRVLASQGREGGLELLVRRRLSEQSEDRWHTLRANPVTDGAGRVTHVVSTFRDVTDVRRHEEAMRLSREWLAVALRSIGDAVVTTDAEGLVTFLNPVAEQLTGWTLADASERPLDEIFRIHHETTREVVQSPVAMVLREGRIVGLANHTMLIARDGSERAIEDSAAPIRLDGGELVGVVLVFRDVSAVRREQIGREFLALASAELSSTLDYETTLRTIARLAVPRIADWCAVDMRVDGDQGWRRLAVAHVDPAKLDLVSEIEKKYPPDRDAATGVPNVLRTGKSEMMALIPSELLDAAARDPEHLVLIRSLRLRSYLCVPIRAGGETWGVVTLVMAESNRTYDETDLTLAEDLGARAGLAVQNASLYRTARTLRDEAEAANEVKDEFLAMLGHELRNPLAPIVTALELMGRAPDAPFVRERTVIQRQLHHVVRLVDDLLDVARITRGKVELARERVTVGEVVDRAVEMSSPLIEQRRHALALDVAADLVVDGDATRLAQIVANIVQNAAKYTEVGGHIAVRAALEEGLVTIRVRDDGQGVAPEMLARMFELFAQDSQSLARSRGGLGLGLAIVRSLVQLHGGTVEARSEGVGHGTEIVVRLPAATAAPVAPKARAPLVRPTVAGKVLVVDDNADAREMVAAALELDGWATIEAADAASAMEVARRERPDVALLDIGLPDVDGYELARQLRALPELAEMRLIALTGYGQSTDRAESAVAGFDVHLTKPVPLDQLRAALQPEGLQTEGLEPETATRPPES